MDGSAFERFSIQFNFYICLFYMHIFTKGARHLGDTSEKNISAAWDTHYRCQTIYIKRCINLLGKSSAIIMFLVKIGGVCSILTANSPFVEGRGTKIYHQRAPVER
jgi:hypothetical protein